MRPGLPVALAGVVFLSAAQSSRVPDLQVEELADGPHARMHMLLEKTIFAVDVLTVDIRFGHETAERFARLVTAASADSAVPVAEIAQAAAEAERAFIRVEFQRDVSLDRWVLEVRSSLELAWQSGLIEQDNYQHVSRNLPIWFESIAERGFRDGDALLYRVYPDRMRTVLVSPSGDVLVDQTDPGTGPRRALLGGYFAPGSDFREPLVRSMLEESQS